MRANRTMLAPALATVAIAVGGCRISVASLPQVDVWKPGQRAIVVPLRGSEIPDAQVAAVVSDRLRALGAVDVLAPAPGNVPTPTGEPFEACMQAHALGADYVVVTRAEISLLDNQFCLVGTGLLSKLVLPLPIPIPLGGKVAIVDVPVAVPSRCLISVEIGDRWSVTASAEVFATEQCEATGGQFAFTRGTDGTAPDGEELRAQIENKTADLFPDRATIASVEGDRAVVVAPRDMRAGDLYEVRDDARAAGDLAYVRSVDAGAAILERYARSDELRPGDLLLRRGKPQWIELLPYAAASVLTIGDTRHGAAGAGGLFRGQFGALSVGLAVEYLRLLDGAVRRDTDTTSTLKGGLQGGLHHHVGPSLDVHVVLELGMAGALGVGTADAGVTTTDGGTGYAAMFAGARLAIGPWFAAVEVGGVYSGRETWQDHAAVAQRGLAARLMFGRNARPDLEGTTSAEP